MRYHVLDTFSKDDAKVVLSSGDIEKSCEVLVAVALNEPDWRWVQEKCLEAASNADPRIRCISATCLGHLARIHGELDLARVLPVLAALCDDPETQGCAEDALSDIKMFIRNA